MRQRINNLRYTKPYRKPQAINKLTSVPHQTVIDICKRDEDLLRRARPNRALKYKITREQVLQIEADMEGHWGKSSMTIQELIDFYGLDCVP
jgi:hypothetical protein